jgi:N-acylneuraminate cytidylyltransferase/CMP-N,N'-diacetyllegionaminic acid synthase
MSLSTLGLIPARGGSEGIEGKNIKELDGMPLIAHTINAAHAADCIDSTVVSTDSDEIAVTAESYGARVPFRRPDCLATDDARTEPVIKHAISSLREVDEQYDDFVLLQPTSPLRSATHIEDAYEQYLNAGADSLISAYPTNETRWRRTPDGTEQLNYKNASARRQDREPEYVSNGAIYITTVHDFIKTTEVDNGITEIYPMAKAVSVDVDTSFDFWMAEKVIQEWSGRLD